jgi:hypothetical protein
MTRCSCKAARARTAGGYAFTESAHIFQQISAKPEEVLSGMFWKIRDGVSSGFEG